MKIQFVIDLILTFTANYVCGQNAGSYKINGLNLVSERYFIDSSHVDPIVQIGANFASVIPYCFMPALDSSLVIFGGTNHWAGEGLEGTRVAVQELQKKKLRTMIKPQIWVNHDVFTGEIEMKSEASWLLFEDGYSAYVLAFAKIAEEENVEILCIGTEMAKVVSSRPELFPRLIEKVRNIYSGKITYAENWDQFSAVGFWGKLDYIGIDAYFPISDKRNPSLKTLERGWVNYLPNFDSISTKFDKKILFTEFGYRSIKKCACTPWAYKGIVKPKIDETAQYRALKALFESLWNKEYFAGGFLWKWHPNHESAGGEFDSSFTVQNKKAMEVVQYYFKKSKVY